MTRLATTRPPFLPVAPAEYETRFHNQHSDVLRLYFNQLDNILASVLAPRGGKWLDFPYGAIQRTTDKSFTANTATQITFDTNDFLNGMANDGTDGIAVEQSGIYNYQFSVQIKNTDTQIHSCLLYTSPSPRDRQKSRMPSSA